MATDRVDSLGRAVTVSCSSCHGNLVANAARRSGADLTLFHQGLKTAHGDLTCLTCHDPNDYDRLRLADNTPVPYQDVMALCSQCHASVARDYQFGAHGGSNGHWDLTRGPRQRKNCIDCHDPHAPAFPLMRPTFHPRDRFLETKGKPHE